jgi:hypothetical protein
LKGRRAQRRPEDLSATQRLQAERPGWNGVGWTRRTRHYVSCNDSLGANVSDLNEALLGDSQDRVNGLATMPKASSINERQI